MKKILIFAAIILVLFGGIVFLTNYQQDQASEGNPYGKDELHPETIKQLDDPNYSNLILPDELKESLQNSEDMFVYFYSPTCPHCQQTTPVLMPLAEEENVDVKQFNLLEFEDGWTDYQIESTPTLVYYENGVEQERIVGSQPEENFEAFFQAHKEE
ncbi:thioredoxin family protein [Bacillus thermotolerans]|uniref:Thioredoxin n=1 Tax=Bacillus thermotolerans TaxID=1221996 RepID=A0A0F5HRL6_BACTR|nr:thioredoxin family protein [Bacillus thermotolerans]KKB35655.1 Thioredoxin [Bacillus thermotolerans]KKB40486.1 Thioredoxin [Bacillus thermotolerans]KKB42887.1 Thioredoxin [Bacillus thermotolerans]